MGHLTTDTAFADKGQWDGQVLGFRKNTGGNAIQYIKVRPWVRVQKGQTFWARARSPFNIQYSTFNILLVRVRLYMLLFF